MMKTCTKCQTEKPLTAFQFRKDTGRYYADCRECRVARTKAWREANRDHYNAKTTEWRHQTIEQQRDNRKQWRLENPDKVIESRAQNWERVKDTINQRKRENTQYKHFMKQMEAGEQ